MAAIARKSPSLSSTQAGQSEAMDPTTHSRSPICFDLRPEKKAARKYIDRCCCIKGLVGFSRSILASKEIPRIDWL